MILHIYSTLDVQKIDFCFLQAWLIENLWSVTTSIIFCVSQKSQDIISFGLFLYFTWALWNSITCEIVGNADRSINKYLRLLWNEYLWHKSWSAWCLDQSDLKQSLAFNFIKVFIKTSEQKPATKSITVKIIFHDWCFSVNSLNCRYKAFRCSSRLKHTVLSKRKRRYYSFFNLSSKFKKTEKVPIKQRAN